jgi:hypothetical protein
LWSFHVDWDNPANSVFSGPTNIPVAAFTPMCNGDTCITQPGTTQQLDTLADRLMYRLAYRNFGDHESLVVNHTVDAGGGVAGVRWYELRSPGATPTVFQQGTFAPDGAHRWMGSAAMDKAGNFAIGYSVSSATVFPSIRFAGRLVGDPLGQLGQGESTLFTGAGSQGSGLARWGDYSSLVVDPTNDCTFWYTTEYIAATGTFNWHTRIGSFTFPSCGSVSTDDFSVSATPTSATVDAGASTVIQVSTAITAGAAQPLTLSASGLPSGVTATFANRNINSGEGTTLTLSAGSFAPSGTYTVTISGAGTVVAHSATVALTVVNNQSGILNGGFESGDLSAWTPSGTTSISTTAHGGSYAAMIGSTAATVGDSAITQTFTVPQGAARLQFYYQVHCPDSLTYDWATAQLTDNTSGTTTTLLAPVCSNTSAWVQVVSDISAMVGHSVTLRLVSHDDGYPSDPTYTLYDDVRLLGPPSPIVNGDFENGDLSGWTPAGAASIVGAAQAHGGSFAARVGADTATAGDSSLTQTFNVPAVGGELSFYYQEHCPDVLQNDWTTVTLKDNVTNTTRTLLPPTCKNLGVWVKVSADLTASAGHSVTLTLTAHDDDYPGDPTYALFDDVTFVNGPPPPPPIVNGDFEKGTLEGWDGTGATSVVNSGAHGGQYAAAIGSPSAPTDGDSTLAHAFKVPTAGGTLSFWYQSHCNDVIAYDWATVTLVDTTSGSTLTLLDKTCKNTGAWVQVSTNLATLAGHTVTLTFTNHDDNYAADPNWTLVDDVTVQ